VAGVSVNVWNAKRCFLERVGESTPFKGGGRLKARPLIGRRSFESQTSNRDLTKGKNGFLWGSGYEFVAHEARKSNIGKTRHGFRVFMRLGGNFRNAQREVLGLVCSISLLVFDAILRRPLPLLNAAAWGRRMWQGPNRGHELCSRAKYQ